MDEKPAIGQYLPGPDVDDHVVLVTHADDILAVGGEGHAGHPVLVLLELADLAALQHGPDPHGGHMPTLTGKGIRIQ